MKIDVFNIDISDRISKFAHCSAGRGKPYYSQEVGKAVPSAFKKSGDTHYCLTEQFKCPYYKLVDDKYHACRVYKK